MSIEMIIGKEVYAKGLIFESEECILGGTSFKNQSVSRVGDVHIYTCVRFVDSTKCVVPPNDEMIVDF